MLDQFADASQGAAPAVAEQVGTQTIDLNLSLVSSGAGFAHSGAGGADTDGSEAVTSVAITLSTGTLVLAGYAGAAALTDNGGGSYTLSGWSDFADLQAAIDALSAEVPGGFDGAITGQLGITTGEANTPAGTAPASGAEPDISDNVRVDVTGFSASVAGDAGTPTASIAVDGSGYFKEDAANTVHLAAAAGDSTDQLTTVVVAGLSWGVSGAALAALEADPSVASASFAAGTLTITLEPGVESFGYDLELTPPEDSDVDLSGVTITANVEDKTDPSATNGTTSAPITLVVDAVLDQFADVTGSAASGSEAAAAQQIALGLSLALIDTGPGVPSAAWNAPSDEPNDTTVADGDGSESISVSITVDATATAAGVDLVLNGAPAGAALSETAPGNGVWTLTAASPADLSAAVAAVKAAVPAGYDGTVTGTIAAVSTEANTPAGSAPASGAEPDVSDNSVSDDAGWSLSVSPGDGTPNVVLAGLTAGQLVIKEDNSGFFTVTASTVDATDKLTAVSLGNLNLPAGWTVVVTDGGAGGSYSAVTGVYTPVGSVTSAILTVTITPPEDSDVDVANVMPGDISVTASAQDLGGGPVFTSAAQVVDVNVDAVLDRYADVAGAATAGSETAGAQQVALGLSLALVNTGPGVPGAAWNAPSHEPNDTTVADGDGSESIAVSITVDATATAAGVDLVLNGAPAGAALSETAPGSGVWTLSVSSPADLSAAVAAVKAALPAGYDGTITGTITAVSSEANTPGAVPGSVVAASGQEHDTSDNSVNDSAGWSLTVSKSGVPDAVDDDACVVEGNAINYQLMLILDVSGSMSDDPDGPGGYASRLALAIASLNNLIDSYVGSTSGTVQVKVVTFSDSAAYLAGNDSTFVSAAAAQTALNSGLTPQTFTDYDTAVAVAAGGISNGGWVASDANTQGLVYFLSDGKPTSSDGSNPNTIEANEELAWQQVLQAKGVQAIAVGVGADIAAGQAGLDALGTVAFTPGTSGYADSDVPVIVVANETELGTALANTVPGVVTGNVITNDSGGADGFPVSPDNKIVDVNLSGGGTLISKTTVADMVTIVTSNGTLTLNLETGAYQYTAKPNTGGNHDAFLYTIQDAIGGDQDSATLNIDIGERIVIAEGAVDPNATGSEICDVITGNSLANVINGLGGDDVIYGKGGNDTLDGGDGNDRIFGGSGNDLMTGGAGSDVFGFTLGDQGEYAITTKTYSFQDVTKANNIANAYEFEVAQAGDGSLTAVAGPGASGLDLREASDFQYSQMFGDDQAYWTTTNASSSRHVVFWAQFELTENPSDINQIALSVNARQAGNPGGSEDAQFGVWNYSTNSWEVLDLDDADGSDNTFNGTLTSNIANYLDGAGKITLALYNEDETNGWLIDDVRVTVTSNGAPTVTDTVTDFTAGLGGDVLDFNDLLPSSVNNATSTNVLDDYLHFQTDGTNTTILIDHDGGASFQPTMQVVLQGVDLVTGAGSDADIIQTLISQGNLAV